jgi:glucose-6-phosphate isomerase
MTRHNSLLQFDPSRALAPRVGIEPKDLQSLVPKLDAARKETLDDMPLMRSGENIPPEKEPLDAGFIDLPERLLADYQNDRAGSELGRILAAANQFAAAVDRLVVLGIGGSYMGARALWEACCHPYWNELSRAERGGRPRIYFEGNNVDNDAMQGLLDVLPKSAGASPEDRWGIVVISKSGGTLETALAFRMFFAALKKSSGDAQPAVIPVTGPGSQLEKLAAALGCGDPFPIPDGVGGRFSVLTAVGLLPAAILGIDVVALLEGAAAMNEHFRTAPVDENVVLQLVGVGHLAEAKIGATIRVQSAWNKSLEAAGLWYDQLLSESLGKNQQGATPITGVNTRDLHSRGQQHQQGRRDKLITNWIVDQPRQDRLAIASQTLDQDGLNAYAGKTVPEVLAAAIDGTNAAYAEDHRPTVDLHLPQCDAHAMGQLFQLLMLATVVEGRLIGVNPYGQPGVEGYKRHMKANLSRGK